MIVFSTKTIATPNGFLCSWSRIIGYPVTSLFLDRVRIFWDKEIRIKKVKIPSVLSCTQQLIIIIVHANSSLYLKDDGPFASCINLKCVVLMLLFSKSHSLLEIPCLEFYYSELTPLTNTERSLEHCAVQMLIQRITAHYIASLKH